MAAASSRTRPDPHTSQQRLAPRCATREHPTTAAFRIASALMLASRALGSSAAVGSAAAAASRAVRSGGCLAPQGALLRSALQLRGLRSSAGPSALALLRQAMRAGRTTQPAARVSAVAAPAEAAAAQVAAPKQAHGFTLVEEQYVPEYNSQVGRRLRGFVWSGACLGGLLAGRLRALLSNGWCGCGKAALHAHRTLQAAEMPVFPCAGADVQARQDGGAADERGEQRREQDVWRDLPVRILRQRQPRTLACSPLAYCPCDQLLLPMLLRLDSDADCHGMLCQLPPPLLPANVERRLLSSAQAFLRSCRTPVANSRGVPHILEHSVLCGSRKYPIKVRGRSLHFRQGVELLAAGNMFVIRLAPQPPNAD